MTMQNLPNFDFVVGIAAGKILLGALLASSIFRSVALAVAASAICVLYLQKGVAGLLGAAHLVTIDFMIRPDFSKGMALGAILAIIVFGIYMKRKPS